MTATQQLGKHFREVYFGGNWTTVNLKDVLSDISWQEAVTKVHGLNTIAALVFHVNYYVNPVSKVLDGEPLDAHDKYSYDVPEITNDEAWRHLADKALHEAEQFANAVEQLDESILFNDFAGAGKYGSYYRNLLGLIEHTHYHLGQIAIIKKMIRSNH